MTARVVHLPIVAEAPPRGHPRNRRKREVRSRTQSMKRMTKSALAVGKMVADLQLSQLGEVARPRTRADCEGGARPCPFVSCKHHLYLEVKERTGSIKIVFPDVDADMDRGLDELPATCSLDVADDGGATLERVGEIMNLTRERVRQIQRAALDKVADVLLPLLRAGADDARERGLPRAPIEAEREQGTSHFDARDMWTPADEFLIPEVVLERIAR